MAITYPLTFPTTVTPAALDMEEVNIVAVTTSPFTGEQDVQVHDGAYWRALLTWPPTERSEAEEILAFLGKLRGQFGTFLMGDISAGTNRGSAESTPGTPVTSGAQTLGAQTLVMTGGALTATNYLREGDYIQLSTGAATTRLYKVLADFSTDGAGAGTIDIWPPLREAYADATTVVVSGALGRWRLATNNLRWSVRTVQYGITVPIIEAL